jgi:DNA-binding CsgD family transcriptional regulator
LIHPIDLQAYAIALARRQQMLQSRQLGFTDEEIQKAEGSEGRHQKTSWLPSMLLFSTAIAMIYFGEKEKEKTRKQQESDVSEDELALGINREIANTRDYFEARRAAYDQLIKKPDYYSQLEKSEKAQNPYTVNERMKDNARDSYALGFIKIDPRDFLNLTTWGEDYLYGEPRWIHVENQQRGMDYKKFEEIHAKEKSVIHPHLTIDISTGQVTGHEGRHRAAAAEAAGEDFYIYIYPDYESKTHALKHDVMAGNGEKYIPDVLIGQFDPNIKVRLDKSTVRQNPRSKKVLELSDDEIGKLYQEGYSTTEIGDLLGVTDVTILNRLKELGVKRRTLKKDLILSNDEIKELYERGYSSEKLAKMTGVTPHTILERLTKMGVQVRAKSFAASKLSDNEIKRLYEAGYTNEQIANQLGVSPTTTLIRLHSMGVQMRRTGRRSKILELPVDDIKQLYQEGYSTREIADLLGVARKTLFNLIGPMGTRMRRNKKTNPIPPASVAAEAREGLKLRSSVSPSRRGGTSVGIARARQLSSRQNISDNTLKRMRSFFARHEVDKKAKGFRRGEKGYPSKGLQAWKLWGGDAGKKWAKKFR